MPTIGLKQHWHSRRRLGGNEPRVSRLAEGGFRRLRAPAAKRTISEIFINVW
jgi:hypothetical protein